MEEKLNVFLEEYFEKNGEEIKTKAKEIAKSLDGKSFGFSALVISIIVETIGKTAPHGEEKYKSFIISLLK